LPLLSLLCFLKWKLVLEHLNNNFIITCLLFWTWYLWWKYHVAIYETIFQWFYFTNKEICSCLLPWRGDNHVVNTSTQIWSTQSSQNLSKCLWFNPPFKFVHIFYKGVSMVWCRQKRVIVWYFSLQHIFNVSL
jgi:hypothetical protein